jgi:osmotically-inducible protein OsmY
VLPPRDHPEDYRYGGDAGRWDRNAHRRRNPRHDDRGFFDKAADEVQSWFGDDEAERRREMDHHRGKGPRGYQRSDERISDDVHDRLTEDPTVDATDITVTVKDREVTLDGTVHSRLAKRDAEDIAYDVSGVEHVQVNLRVRAPDDDRTRHTL